MGLGPLMAIYQARFLKYMAARGVVDPGDRKVWAFMGDGEMDEPESMGAISLAGRERLDNLVFVVNCNLQRLDGPVRGNGKIIQELETNFTGAGWNVIKVIWGSGWDPLLEADESGALHRLMEECVDGEYQTFKANDGAYVREHFFGRYPETRAMVEDWSDAFLPARVLNLVVIVDREFHGARSRTALQRVGRYHPSRLAASARSTQGRKTLDARATIGTDDGEASPGHISVGRERIVISMGPQHLGKLDTVVDPLLVPDLATVVWSPHGHTDAVDALRRLAQIVLLDSQDEPTVASPSAST